MKNEFVSHVGVCVYAHTAERGEKDNTNGAMRTLRLSCENSSRLTRK